MISFVSPDIIDVRVIELCLDQVKFPWMHEPMKQTFTLTAMQVVLDKSASMQMLIIAENVFDRKSDCERKKPACRPSETRLTSDQWRQEPLRTQPRFCMQDLQWEDKLLLNTFNGSWSNISLSSAVPHIHQTQPQIHNWVSSFCFILKHVKGRRLCVWAGVEHHRRPSALLFHTRIYLMTCDALSHSMQYPAFGKVNVQIMSMHICSPAFFYLRTWEMNHISVKYYSVCIFDDVFVCKWVNDQLKALFIHRRKVLLRNMMIWGFKDVSLWVHIWWIL